MIKKRESYKTRTTSLKLGASHPGPVTPSNFSMAPAELEFSLIFTFSRRPPLGSVRNPSPAPAIVRSASLGRYPSLATITEKMQRTGYTYLVRHSQPSAVFVETLLHAPCHLILFSLSYNHLYHPTTSPLRLNPRTTEQSNRHYRLQTLFPSRRWPWLSIATLSNKADPRTTLDCPFLTPVYTGPRPKACTVQGRAELLQNDIQRESSQACPHIPYTLRAHVYMCLRVSGIAVDETGTGW